MTFLKRLLVAGSVLVCLGASPEQYSRDELNRLEAERKAAVAKLQALESAETVVKTDLSSLETDLISAAMESRRREEQATASELRLIDLNTRLAKARDELALSERALEDLIATLATSSRHPPPALVVSPDEANRAIRSAIIMGDVAPRLNEMTINLAKEIEELRRLEADVRKENARLDAAEATLALKQVEIEQMAAQKRANFENVSDEAERLRKRVGEIAQEAETLKELLAALEDTAPRAPRMKPEIVLASTTPSPAKTPVTRAPSPTPTIDPNLKPLGASDLGGLAQPVTGMVSVGWGDKLPGGEPSQGLYLQPRSEAQVTSPVDGRIEYAEPFRSYGLLLIIATSDGYHVLLSGMGQIYGTPGQTVKTGEPVGRMPARETPPPELYMEIRKDGRPMDPARWMKRG